MESQRIGSRGIIFTFDDPYHFNVYVIVGNHHVFICDTFCGPDPMKEIVRSLKQHGFLVKNKEYVVFNSHYHYDHIWGNSAFGRDMILAHRLCNKLIAQFGKEALLKYKDHAKGDVELVFPNANFSKKRTFLEEGVVFFHSPGHTEDSSSCYDRIDKVLFAGDNVESPIPFFYQPDLKIYESTLENYLSIEWETLVASHDPLMTDKSLIQKNIEYVQDFSTWKVDFAKLEERTLALHLMNLGSFAEMTDKKEIGEKGITHYKEAIRYAKAVQHSDEREKTISQLRRFIE